MEFVLDDDQRELQATVRGIVDKECTIAFVRSVIDDGVDPGPWWRTMTELYWPALAIPEADGGLGLGWVELALLVEELGRAQDPSPFVATTTQFVPAVRHCGDAAQALRWSAAVAAGEVVGALALGHVAGHGSVTATAVDGGWRLNGTARYVVEADRADAIAVAAEGPDGLAVFVVERATAGSGLTCEMIPVFDHAVHIGTLAFDGVDVPSDARLRGADVAGGVTAALDEATLGWATATVGACQRILDLALAHVREREQFGVKIGSFQAVKHKAVDVYVAIERARALCQYAALCLAEGDDRASIAVSMAKAAAGDCQDVSVRHGVQLFGGMGFTWENDVQIAARRAKLGAQMFGSTGEHRRRIAREVLAR